jgi:hypothetical protein
MLAGCVSDTEKTNRREDAFDVSGIYKVETDGGSDLDMTFEIKNESGRHDIVVTLDRGSEMSDQEKAAFERQGIASDQVFSYFNNPMILGQGHSSIDLDGGENISDDGGLSTHFSVCTPDYKHSAQSLIRYCLTGNVNKESELLKGRLTMYISKLMQEEVDGKTIDTFRNVETVAFQYQTKAKDHVLQYLGEWKGSVQPIGPSWSGMEVFAQMNLSQTSDERFLLRSGIERFELNGETFDYSQSQSVSEKEQIVDAETPFVVLTFIGNKGRSILAVGQIWSLGELSGTILAVDGKTTQPLASFRLKK